MQEKVLVLDIDGTLTNSKKEITEATKQGIWNILQHGHKVILASGRPTPGMRKCEEELELKKYGGYLVEDSTEGILQGMYDYANGKIKPMNIDYAARNADIRNKLEEIL